MNIYREYVTNNLFVFAGQILTNLKGIILLPIIIKFMGVTTYGNYTLLITGIMFLLGISSFGVGFKFKRFAPSSPRNTLRTLFYSIINFNILTIAFLSIVIFIFNESIINILFKQNIDYSITLVILILFAGMLNSKFNDYYRYTHRMKIFSISTFSVQFIFIIIALILIFFFNWKDINTLLIAHLLGMIIVLVLVVPEVLKEIGISINVFNKIDLRDEIKFGLPMVLNNIVDFILNASDRYLIAIFLTATDVGYYNPAYILGSFIVIIPKIIAVALPPLLAKVEDENDKKTFNNLVQYSFKSFLFIAIPFLGGSIIYGKVLLRFISTDSIADTSYLIVPIVTLGTLFYGVSILYGEVLFAKLKTTLLFKINSLAAIVNIVLNIFLLYFIRNIMIAAVTTLISYLTAFIYLNRNVNKLGAKIKLGTGFISKIIVSTVAMCLITILLLTILNPLICLFVSVALYLAICLSLNVFSKGELLFFKNLVFSRN